MVLEIDDYDVLKDEIVDYYQQLLGKPSPTPYPGYHELFEVVTKHISEDQARKLELNVSEEEIKAVFLSLHPNLFLRDSKLISRTYCEEAWARLTPTGNILQAGILIHWNGSHLEITFQGALEAADPNPNYHHFQQNPPLLSPCHL